MTEQDPGRSVASSRSEDHVWDGATLRTSFVGHVATRREQIADAARDGRWPRLFELLESGEHVNRCRIGGKHGFAPLHQAAWHGASTDMAKRLLGLGAWRTLQTTAGETALDIAQARGHQHLLEVLRPAIRHPVPADALQGLEQHLHLLIRGRSAELVVREQIRLPQLAPITELAEPRIFFPIPGQYGGFSINLLGEVLKVASWNRQRSGWAQIHAVTRNSIQLTDDAWDLRLPDAVRSAEPRG